MFEDKDYSVEEGYEIMKKYVSTLGSEEAAKAVDDVPFDAFKDAYEEYAQNPRR